MGTTATSRKPIDILLVEDNAGDVVLTREAFDELDIPPALHVARDGDETLDFLYQRGQHESARRPDLILLDLNMPGRNGKEVLAAIKDEQSLRVIPVVILTSSEAENDVAQCYGLHASAYVVKPVNLDDFQRVVKAVEAFWLNAVTYSRPE
jgi:CheY-like chemotaxis protein